MNFGKLNLFFDKIKNLGFWQRLFGWRPVQSLSFEAYEEFCQLARELDEARRKADQNASEAVKEAQADKRLLEERLVLVRDEKAKLETRLSDALHKITRYEESEAGNKRKVEDVVEKFEGRAERIENERRQELELRQQQELNRLTALKDTWSKHQEIVKNKLKTACEKLAIDYVEKVPFKGIPDNTIKICDEFVIFDAKSPGRDDELSNFPTYIRNEAEKAKKYAKEDLVRRDIFFVVPTNAVEVLPQMSHNMVDYNVYIVTERVLEPFLLVLKKLEEYKYVNELTPENRDSICRIIGKLLHVTKRRVVVDQYFTEQILDTIRKSEAEVPDDIADRVAEFEKAEALNPPQEKRGKDIASEELEAKHEKINRSLSKTGKTRRINLDDPLVLPATLVDPPIKDE